MRNIDFSNRRVEPRFHPGKQSLLWHRVDESGPPRMGWLTDISLSGLRFGAATSAADAPELTDRIEVHQFPGSKPMFYEVVWVGKQNHRCMLGCARIFPSPKRAGVRKKPTGFAAAIENEPERMALAA